MWPSFFCFHWRAVDAYLQGRWNIICHVKQDDYWATLFQVTLTQGAKKSWILACPLDKHLLHFACLEPLHPLLEDDLPGPYPIGHVCVKSYLPSIKIYLSLTTRRDFSWALSATVSEFMRIRHYRNNKGTGAKMLPAIVSGIITGHEPVSYWLIFSLSLVTIPEVFAKLDSSQFPIFSFLTWQIPSAESSFNNTSRITPVNTWL